MDPDRFLVLAEQIGFEHRAALDPASLILRTEIREMCAADRCGNYNRSWSCPPACGDLTDLRRRIAACGSGILVQTTGQLEDSFDLESIRRLSGLHSRRFDKLVRQAKLLQPGLLAMGSGGCRRCRRCSYPEAPCRFPDRCYPSMEACGLWVSEVCRANGLGYNYGGQTMTYTAALLFPEQERKLSK